MRGESGQGRSARQRGINLRMILAGDVGGTKTELSFFVLRRGILVSVAVHRVRSRAYAGLEDIVEEMVVGRKARLTAACFGVAGPVRDGRCEATNLPWVIDERILRRMLGLKRVGLVNDLEAMAYGVEALPAKSLRVLRVGCAEPRGAKAVIAAGTGLGEAALIWDGRDYRAVSSEGGHADFAPRTELEVELWRFLTARFGHVSYERILSGPGKVAVYEFLRESGYGTEPAWLTRRLASGDPSAVISDVALSGRSGLCSKALDLFASIYGAEAGNLALKFLATGGVYLGGGIAPTIIRKLGDGAFMNAFTGKGRLAGLLSRIPVRVILEGRTALLGAARCAQQFCRP